MKIFCFISSLGPGGAERVVANLSNFWVLKGHEVSVVIYDKRAEPFFYLENKVNLVKCDLSGGSLVKRFYNHIFRIPTFRRIIKEGDPDIVVSFIDRTNVLVLLSTIGLKVPTVVSERIDPRFYSPGLFWNWLRKRIYHRASAVVALSQQQADWFSKFCQNVYVIPNPVPSVPSEPTGKCGPSNKVVAAGRLVKQKGFDILIESFSRAIDRDSGWILEIFGEGPERNALQRQIDYLQLSHQIRLMGLAENLPDRLKDATCFVLSSRFEGFPNVLLEALNNRCPPIAVDCTDSIRDILQDGTNGIIVPLGDIDKLSSALARMITDRNYRNRLAENGPRISQKFGIQEISARWETLFESVTGQRVQPIRLLR
ncbi:MAG: glycosyltransferase family 4 protein [Gammaproteobacteria bacterium]